MTPQELKERKNYIGGSDAPIIMEVSPWTTPLQLWEIKLGLRQDFGGNIATREGIRMEPIARKEFENLTGLLMFPERRFSEQYKFMMASLDGISLDGKHAVEIKCPGKEDHEKALDGIIPDKYYPQLQHQMCVLNLEMIFYFSFNGKENKIIEVYKDNDYISNLIEKESAFYNLIKSCTAPEMSAKDYRNRTDINWLEKSLKWQQLQEQIEDKQKELQPLQEAEEKLRQELIDLSEGVNSVGGGIKLTKIIRKGNVDYASIPDIKNINLDIYRKSPTQYWKLGKL